MDSSIVTDEESIADLVRLSAGKIGDAERIVIKSSVQNITAVAKVNGLSSASIQTISDRIICTEAYDVGIRKSLLFALVPEKDFPYIVVPALVSTMNTSKSSTWHYAVLSWLAGLLEYNIVDRTNLYIRICYTPIFNWLQRQNLSAVACKTLHYITKREDICPGRVHVLIVLRNKPEFKSHVTFLLQLYKMFRPDLLAGSMNIQYRMAQCPGTLLQAITSAVARLKVHENIETGDGVWPISSSHKQFDTHSTRDVAQPEVVVHTEKIEDRKALEHKVFLIQFRTVKQFVKALPQWRNWQWPTNPASLLRRPALLPLFRSNSLETRIALTDWLEFALKAEFIDHDKTDKNSERQKRLLECAANLARDNATTIPVVYIFIMKYLITWDGVSYWHEVLALLTHMPYFSVETPNILLTTLSNHLTGETSILEFCQVVDALGKMSVTWAIQASIETHQREGGASLTKWPTNFSEKIAEASITGLFIFVQSLKAHFLEALMHYSYHPCVVHAIIDYYCKLNLCTSQLKMVVRFWPRAELTLAIMINGDLVSKHRLGKLFVEIKSGIEDAHSILPQAKDSDHIIGLECLRHLEEFNVAVSVYTDVLKKDHHSLQRHMATLEEILHPAMLNEVKRSRIKNAMSLHFSMACLPMHLDYTIKHELYISGLQGKLQEVDAVVLKGLDEHGMTGIRMCLDMFAKNQ